MRRADWARYRPAVSASRFGTLRAAPVVARDPEIGANRVELRRRVARGTGRQGEHGLAVCTDALGWRTPSTAPSAR
jgi:hypothetical protein